MQRRGFFHSAPVRLTVGIAAIAVGIALFLVPMPVQVMTLAIGLGVLLTGLFVFFTPHLPSGAGTPILSRAMGGVIAALGAVIALWPDAGAPVLAFLIGAALI